jgi:ornithine carbamoyltransferase
VATVAARESVLKIAAPDLSRDLDLTDDEVQALLTLAGNVKRAPANYAQALAGRYLALLFEKPSLRTRLTFELAIKQLGGDAVFSEGRLGAREPVKDVARNLDRWVQGIVARTYSQETIEELARWSAVPVINALSDRFHPCQALADVLTLKEQFGELRSLKLAYVGDGNNVAHSLMLTAARLGMDFALAAPAGYGPNMEIVAQAQGLAALAGGHIEVSGDPHQAVTGAHAVYTDVWTSMGQEETEKRRAHFHAFQVNEHLFGMARADAVFMHCLPAKRGQETSDAVFESSRSVVFDQAENRLHAQKALLLMLLA